MTRRLVLTVEDSFDIRTVGGLIVTPAPRIAEIDGPRDFDATLELPDGSRRAARLSIRHEFLSPSPPPDERRWACVLVGLSRGDAPVGTRIWIAN